MARDAAALVDHLGLRSVDVVGYSMGALVATRLVPDEPRARSCVLGGIGGRVRNGRGFDAAGRAAIADALLAADAATVRRPAARAFRAFADSTGADRRALAAIQQARTPATPTRLEAITVPTMVIVGDRDELAGSAKALAARIPGAIARTVRGTHLGAVNDPAFPQAIVDFLTSVAPV